MRRSEFEIKDKTIIEDIFSTSDYGTFALCMENRPYSIPVNFVYDGKVIYFHGAKKGRKKEYILANNLASFNIAQPYSIIQSYFTATDGMACPATHFFRSVCCDGRIIIVENYDEKVKALTLLMKKLQPEGKYKPLDEEIYKKMINAVEVFRFEIEEVNGKLKVGQNLPKEKINMILENLEKRDNEIDKLTMKAIMEQYN